MKIAIDFDGVLVERVGIPRIGPFYDNGPMPDTKQAIEWLLSENHDLYVFTNRDKGEWENILAWLKKWSIPKLRITNQKEKNTAIYLDDRAIRFTNWKDFCKYLG